MEKQKFSMLYEPDITESIQKLISESSNLKTEIFKSSIMDKDINKEKVSFYISYINNFLKYWEDFSLDLKEKMKYCHPSKGVRTLKYQFVKEYVYGKYDYAAVLQFTDGIIKGNEDKKFKKSEDVQDFFEHTIEKAFNDLPDSVAGLLDSVLIPHDDMIISSDFEAKMFDSISSYPKLFNEKDRIELYKAINKTIEFIGNNSNIKKYLHNDDMKIFISYINNIVEFITYSLSMYAIRVYVINRYAYPFILFSNEIGTVNNASDSMTESTELPNIGEKDLDGIGVTVMRSLDDSVCKDYSHATDIINAFDSFITMIGAESLFGSSKPKVGTYYCPNIEKNIFAEKLISNPLYLFIVKEKYRYRIYDTDGDKVFEEMNQVLKSFIFNDKQGIQGSNSPKQEILHVIRGTRNDIESVKDCKEVSCDLMKFTFQICMQLKSYIDDIIKWKSNEINSPMFKSANVQSLSGEVLRMLTELYSELIIAIIQRARDIEMKYNCLHNDEVNKINNELSIKISGSNSKPTTSNISNSVPDTTRMPIDLSDMYALPAFESMQMYDSYLKSLDMFKDDPYFSEGVNISDIINKITALIAAIRKRWNSFFHNKEFQNAVKYVMDNKQNLSALQFSGVSMQVLPFKNNGSTEIISPTKIFDNLTNGLKSFNEKTISSPEELEKFIKSLYPSETVYSWFTDKDKSNTAAIRYRNYVLFQDETNASDKEVSPIEIKDAEIAKRLKWWIDTVNGASDVNKSLEEIDRNISSSVNAIKAKMVNITNSQSTNNQTPPPPPSPNGNNDNKNNAQQNTQNQQNQNNQQIDDKQSMSNRVLTDINLAITRLYGSIIDIFMFYFRTEYRYIQEAYSKGQK